MKHCWLLVSVLLIIYSVVIPKLFTFPFDLVSFEKEEHTSNDKPLLFVSFYYLTLQISSQQLNRRFKETYFVCCFLWRQPSLVFRLRFSLLSVCLSVVLWPMRGLNSVVWAGFYTRSAVAFWLWQQRWVLSWYK